MVTRNIVQIIRLDLKYLAVSIALFNLLVFIAVALNDQFIRPFVGDVLVVVWMYAFLKAFVEIATRKLLLSVLIFAYAIELGQYFDLVTLLGLHEYRIARIVLGTTFDWLDILAYTLGAALVLVTEWGRKTAQLVKNNSLSFDRQLKVKKL